MIKRAPMLFALALLPLLAAPLAAQEEGEDAVARWRADPTTIFDASEVDLDEFRWIARPLVIFAEDPQMSAFVEQMDLIAGRPEDLARRDVVVITDTDPDALGDIRRQLRPRGFQMTLIAKDGEVQLRKPFPWNVREITRSVDKMTIRQREIREGS